MPSALKTTGPITRPKSSVCGVPRIWLVSGLMTAMLSTMFPLRLTVPMSRARVLVGLNSAPVKSPPEMPSVVPRTWPVVRSMVRTRGPPPLMAMLR